jgi:hypothetical protein
MSKLAQSTFKLTLLLLVLSFVVASPRLSAADNANGPAVQASQPMDLSTFLNSLKTGDQGALGQSLTPAPENKVIYCSYQACPTGQRCWYCHSNWVCIYEYPDPEQVPPGCSGGPA